MGRITYIPNSIDMNIAMVSDTIANSDTTKNLMDRLLERGMVNGEYGIGQSNNGSFLVQLKEALAEGIKEGFKGALEWFGQACIEGLKTLWKFTVDISFYGCMFFSTISLMMAFCGSKKSKKNAIIGVIVYVFIEMLNCMLIENGIITP